MSGSDLFLIAATIFFSALFSGLEIAFVSANRLGIELERKQGTIAGRLLGGLFQRPARVIGTLLVGNNIAMVFYGIFMAKVLEPWLFGTGMGEALVLLSQTIISTLIILVCSEFLPKALFRIDPNGILKVFAIPLRIFHFILWLPMMLMISLSELVLRAFGIEMTTEEAAFGRVDLDHFLQQVSSSKGEEEDVDTEIEYFRNALELSEEKARDRMVPRAQIEAIGWDQPISELLEKFVETGLSKLLVYKENIDDIVGYVHSYDMFRRPRTIRAAMRAVNFIPASMPAGEVLRMFSNQRSHLAVVVDEFGGTAGMVTMEDLLESIVGEIEDEHDREELLMETLAEHEYRLSAGFSVDQLNDELGLKIPESEEYESLAGYILDNTEDIPDEGAELLIGAFWDQGPVGGWKPDRPGGIEGSGLRGRPSGLRVSILYLHPSKNRRNGSYR